MTRRTRHAFGVLLDLALLAASLTISGPVPDAIKIIGIITAGICGGLLIFVCAVLAVGVADQRRPPFEV
jgi:hypothetical protein